MDWIKLGDQNFLHIATGTQVQLVISDTNPTVHITYVHSSDDIEEQTFRAAWVGDLKALDEHFESNSIRAERIRA